MFEDEVESVPNDGIRVLALQRLDVLLRVLGLCSIQNIYSLMAYVGLHGHFISLVDFTNW